MRTDVSRVQAAARSDTGHVRTRNEDAHAVLEGRGLLVVADGMGGHPAGDVASAIAIDVLTSELTPERLEDGGVQALSAELHAANEAILDDADEHPDRHGMGTTAVVAHIDADRSLMALAHVGDSRAYLLRDGDLTRLTEDHVTRGLLGRVLTQVLGSDRDLDPEATEVELAGRDRLLLCTDGLTDMVSDREIGRILDSTDDPDDACEALVTAALTAGGMDNVTVVVAAIVER